MDFKLVDRHISVDRKTIIFGKLGNQNIYVII